MLSLRGEHFCIGVSRQEVAWRVVGHAMATGVKPWSPESSDPLTLVPGWQDKRRRARADVVVGGSVARHWIQAPAPGLRSLAELQALVQSRLEQLYGDSAAWSVTADWHATLPFLCVALPRDLTHQAAKGIRLRTTVTCLIERHGADFPRDGWVVVSEPDVLHVLQVSNHRLQALKSSLLPKGLAAAHRIAFVMEQLNCAVALSGGASDQVMVIAAGTPEMCVMKNGFKVIRTGPTTEETASESSVACWLASLGRTLP